MVEKEETCPYCDSFDFTEVTLGRFFCRDCGEKWAELPKEFSSFCETCGDDHSYHDLNDEDEIVYKYMKDGTET